MWRKERVGYLVSSVRGVRKVGRRQAWDGVGWGEMTGDGMRMACVETAQSERSVWGLELATTALVIG